MNAQLHTHAKAEYSERVEMNDSMTTKTAASIQIRVHIKKMFLLWNQSKYASVTSFSFISPVSVLNRLSATQLRIVRAYATTINSDFIYLCDIHRHT